MKYILYLVILFCFVFSCSIQEIQVEVEVFKYVGYWIVLVDIQYVCMMDDFWLFIIKRVQEYIIVYVLDKCEEEGCMENFLIVGGKLEGVICGAMLFDDMDLYKIIEGVFNFLISVFNLELECILDILIDIIVVGQEVDGYFIIWWIIDLAKLLVFWVKVIDGKCWEFFEVSYEMYNLGYLYEVVYMYYIVIGKINFLDIVLKNVDLMVKIFGDGEGQISIVFGY